MKVTLSIESQKSFVQTQTLISGHQCKGDVLSRANPNSCLESKESCGENIDKMREQILGYNNHTLVLEGINFDIDLTTLTIG